MIDIDRIRLQIALDRAVEFLEAKYAQKFDPNQPRDEYGRWTDGVIKIISDIDSIANALADSFEKRYGWDADHTREEFIRRKKEQLKDNIASVEFINRSSKSIEMAVSNGDAYGDVTYIILKRGETGYEGGLYDSTLRTITIYENADYYGIERLGDATNISSTYIDHIYGTVVHEYGHHYAQTIRPRVETNARVKLENASTEERRYIKKYISYYASTSAAELAAESYAMSKHPDFYIQPNDVINFVMSILDE